MHDIIVVGDPFRGCNTSPYAVSPDDVLGWTSDQHWCSDLWHFDAHWCHMGIAIKHPLPGLWRSGLSIRVPGCQKLQMTA